MPNVKPQRILRYVTLAIIMIACGSVSAQDWQDGGGDRWRQLLEAAKLEGKVVVTAPSPLARLITENFKRDTGLTVDFLGGDTRDQSSRFNREARSSNMTIDIILSGGAQFPLLETNDLKSIKSQIILPGSADGPQWAGGKIKWMDSAGEYMLQGANFVLSYALVNSKLAPADQFGKWQDLLKPQFKGRLASYDPRSGGPGLGIAIVLAQSFGTDFLKRLFIGQDVKYLRDSRQLAEGVARGVYAAALGVSMPDIELFRRQGIKDMDVIIPTDAPGTLVGSFSVLKQAKSSPHPNAAAVFINWYASKPGQMTYSQAMNEPSLRTDIDSTQFPSYLLPKAGVNYLDQYEENWYQNTRTKVQEEVTQALGGN